MSNASKYLGLGWDDPNSAKQLPASNGVKKVETAEEEADKEGIQNKETNEDNIAVARRISLDLEAPKESNNSQSNEQHAQRGDRSSRKSQYYDYSYETFETPITNGQIASGEVIKLYQAGDKETQDEED
ncbi:hypothetical protein BC827DRAFT_1267258 [Russula dissimulans]|nr:hypothetical protein BC827DRAFT_1267258 [Russula dissimulans]